MALTYPDDPAVTLAAGTFTAMPEGYPLDGDVIIEPQFNTAVHDADGDVISAVPVTVPLESGAMAYRLLASNPDGYSRLVDGVRVPLVFFYKVTVRLKDKNGRSVKSPEPALVFLDAAATRVDLDIQRPVGRDQGLLVVRPSVETVGGLSGNITADQLVEMLGPDAVMDAVAHTLADRFSSAYEAARAAALASVTDAPTLSPAGRWDFAYQPTVAGQPLTGTSSGGDGPSSSGPPPLILLEAGDAVPASTPAGTLVVRRPASGSEDWTLSGVWTGTTTALLRTSGSGSI